MKIEVGMYVRTKYGIIEKIKDVLEFDGTDYYLNSFHTAVKVDRETNVAGNKGRITKASYNIMDLIEVGDIVGDYIGNKYEVIQTYSPEGKYTIWVKLSNDTFVENIEEIKSMVTKEQFESMKYEV